MAKTPTTTPAEKAGSSTPADSTVEASVSEGADTYTAEFGQDGKPTGGVQQGNRTAEADLGTTVEKPAKAPATEEGTEPAAGEEDAEVTTEGEEGEGGEPEGTDAPDTSEPLPEYDPENEEAMAKWDDRFFPGDGTKLNVEAFGAELTANLSKEGGKPELNADSYKYLNDRLGVAKEDVDRIIGGQLAAAQLQDQALFAVTGGREGYVSMLEYAKEAYSEAQKETYRAAMKVGGQTASDQIDLLKARFLAAGKELPAGATTPAATGQQRKGKPQRRPSSPAKTATSSSSAGGAGGATQFKDAGEYQAALKGAGRDPAALRTVADKLRRSDYWKASKK